MLHQLSMNHLLASDAIVFLYLIQVHKEYQINPATAGKGVNELVDKGVIYKQRGIGMFVSPHARAVLIEERKKSFISQHIEPLKKEAT